MREYFGAYIEIMAASRGIAFEKSTDFDAKQLSTDDYEEALQQIETMGYAKSYTADPRTLLKIGANFNSAERTIDGWVVER